MSDLLKPISSDDTGVSLVQGKFSDHFSKIHYDLVRGSVDISRSKFSDHLELVLNLFKSPIVSHLRSMFELSVDCLMKKLPHHALKKHSPKAAAKLPLVWMT